MSVTDSGRVFLVIDDKKPIQGTGLIMKMNVPCSKLFAGYFLSNTGAKMVGNVSANLQKFAENAESRVSGIVLAFGDLWKNREADFLQKQILFVYKSKDCAKFRFFPTFA